MFLKGCLRVMTSPLLEADGKLPVGVLLQSTFTELKVGSKKVSLILENTTAVHVSLRAGTPVCRVEAANLMTGPVIEPGLLQHLEDPEAEAAGEPTPAAAAETPKLTEDQRRTTLLENLNLGGLDDWPPAMAAKARALLREYHDIFALDPHELGCTDGVSHEIVVTDSVPIKERFRRIRPDMVEEVREHLRNMLEAGAIRPSNSPWCNAVVLVRKKDGGLRFCIDFRKLNDWTRKDSYPLPRIQETLDYLRGSRIYSSMDFLSGFWQVPMHPDSKKYTAFTVGNLGFFECERMPFGLCNAPATFQRLMQDCLGELNLEYCLIYLDDVIVYAVSESDHLRRLRAVFDRFCHKCLKLKPKKCAFLQTEIVYLAHHVSADGIKPSRENLRAIAEAAPPATYTGIYVFFVNLARHYRRFIKDFSRKARPLNEYLQGDGATRKRERVELTAEVLAAFDTLKRELLVEPVLQLPCFGKPFGLYRCLERWSRGRTLPDGR